MILASSWRKVLLTSHVTSSVGWFGAVLAFLAVAIIGLSSSDAFTIRAAIVALAWVGWYVIVPLAAAATFTGLLQGLLTPWGLWRHYWVIAKTAITVAAMALLVLHMQPITAAAGLASRDERALSRLEGVREQFVVQASAAAVALVIVIVLSVYKPKGLTAHGRRRQVG
ncbi:DUF2269 domain-containing protein [Micromonospora sp. DT81.3]|uniref:DUF2269 domain-containing protein n=1 Tax=Micromonospora sp. DT81.3 TaxID=3416523 RepID=UPI003CF5B6DE